MSNLKVGDAYWGMEGHSLMLFFCEKTMPEIHLFNITFLNPTGTFSNRRLTFSLKELESYERLDDKKMQKVIEMLFNPPFMK